MKAIVTLTLNPAVDSSSEAELIRPIHKIRTSAERFDPGGGGINAGRVINELGGRSFAVYLAGGTPGDVLDHLVEEAGVDFHRIHLHEPTRVSHVVYERKSEQEFRFTPEGPNVSEREWKAALAFLNLLDFDYVLASGSLPRGVPVNFYQNVATIAHAKGARMVADTSGQALVRILEEGAFLVKPSVGELESVVGRPLRDPPELDAAARELIDKGAVEILAVTLGRDGALLATRDGTVRMASPDVPIKSAVGAGDTFIAAMTLALARGWSHREAFRYGIAAGAATVTTIGTELCHRADVDRILELVER
ncbi:MAG: 1-phosphofructokinase family hexose kinase [Pseudomonadota bacterium]